MVRVYSMLRNTKYTAIMMKFESYGEFVRKLAHIVPRQTGGREHASRCKRSHGMKRSLRILAFSLLPWLPGAVDAMSEVVFLSS